MSVKNGHEEKGNEAVRFGILLKYAEVFYRAKSLMFTIKSQHHCWDNLVLSLRVSYTS